MRGQKDRKTIQTLLLLCFSLILSGCGHIGYKPRGFDIPPVNISHENTNPPGYAPRKIVIFFDGTANDEGSDTNVKRLHSLITLQDRKDIASLYILGVGTNLDPIGLVTGSGINARVMLAYEFILNHYTPKTREMEADEIYIFGFSRGAFAARILTTMLNYAGIVNEARDQTALRKYTPKELGELVHAATFPGFSSPDDADKPEVRPGNLKTKLAAKGLISAVNSDNSISVPVKVLGLWDTVEALGSPGIVSNLIIPLLSQPPKTDVDEPNRRYGEKLCNVEAAYHAVSIDDNRATIFTPLLLSRRHLFDGCTRGKGLLDNYGRIKPDQLQEVWFSGAHSDVGGGYANGALSGVSLNWMLNRIKCTGLLPNAVCPAEVSKSRDTHFVREDFFGGSHDPTAGIWSFYPNVSRDLVTYALDKRSISRAEGKPQEPTPLCVHKSVFERRSVIGYQKEHEYNQLSLTKLPSSGQVTVQLSLGDYGKQRSWKWLREHKSSNGSPDKNSMYIQRYPACWFSEAATINHLDPLGEQK